MEVLPSPVGSILTNCFCKRRRRWRDPPIAFPGSAWLRWLSVGRQAGAKSPPIGILAGPAANCQLPAASCQLPVPRGPALAWPGLASPQLPRARCAGFCWARPQNQGLPESNFFYYMYSRKVASCFAWDFGISCRKVLRTPAAQPGAPPPQISHAPPCLLLSWRLRGGWGVPFPPRTLPQNRLVDFANGEAFCKSNW